MISRAAVAQAVEAVRHERAEIAQRTADYETGVLHEGSVELTGGVPLYRLRIVSPADGPAAHGSGGQLVDLQYLPADGDDPARSGQGMPPLSGLEPVLERLRAGGRLLPLM